MPPQSVIRHDSGTIIWQDGKLIGGRARKQLDEQTCKSLLEVYDELDALRPFLRRGSNVANVCVNFVASGYKSDQNTNQCLLHNPRQGLSTKPEDREEEEKKVTRQRQAWGKLAAVYEKVHRIAMDSFASILAPVLDWTEGTGLNLYARQVTGVTFGDCFWPRSHRDNDAWFTVLVCLDRNGGVVEGGDFSFARAGWVLKCKHGDVLVYNPEEYHGTTEFHVASPEDGRVFGAFYMNLASLKSAAITGSMKPLKLKFEFL